jgi:hypothetical protein
MAVSENRDVMWNRSIKLSNILYGPYKNSGLAAALDDVAAEKGEDSKEYKLLKAKFTTYKTELDILNEKLTKQFEEKKQAKADKIAAEKAKKQKEKDARDAEVVQTQLDQARRRDDFETVKAKEEELAALKAPKDAKGQPIVTEEGPVDIGDDKYSGYTISKDGVTKPGGETIVFVETKDAQGNIVPKEYNSLAKARKAFLDQYSQPGQLDALKKQLVDSRYLTPAEAKTADWIFGVDDLLIAHTKESIVDVQYGGAKQPKTIDLFLQEKKAGSGGGGSKTYYEYSTRGEASRMLDGYFNDLLGFGATPEQEDAFFKEVNAAQAKASRTVTDGRIGVGGFLTDADLLLIAAKVAKKAIKNTDLDLILKSGQGSQVAMDIADLQTTANEYGIDMPAAEALKYVVAGVGQKDYLLKQQERLRQLSMTMHPYLKDHIAAGGTVKDVADQYAKRKAAKLGVTVTESIKDPDIMNAVANNMSTAAFDIEMQKKPEWRFTSEAKQVADDFANTMLQTWGLG